MGDILSLKLENLTKNLPQLAETIADAEAVLHQLHPIVAEINKALRELYGTGSTDVLPQGSYLITENGKRRFVTENGAEEARKAWTGTFLLDIPNRILKIKTKDKKEHLPFGTEKLPWQMVRILRVGMSQPGSPFGNRSAKDLEIPHERTWARYICTIRKLLGEDARHSACLHTVSVDRSISTTGYGYVFDKMWNYLVIEKK